MSPQQLGDKWAHEAAVVISLLYNGAPCPEWSRGSANGTGCRNYCTMSQRPGFRMLLASVRSGTLPVLTRSATAASNGQGPSGHHRNSARCLYHRAAAVEFHTVHEQHRLACAGYSFLRRSSRSSHWAGTCWPTSSPISVRQPIAALCSQPAPTAIFRSKRSVSCTLTTSLPASSYQFRQVCCSGDEVSTQLPGALARNRNLLDYIRWRCVVMIEQSAVNT